MEEGERAGVEGEGRGGDDREGKGRGAGGEEFVVLYCSDILLGLSFSCGRYLLKKLAYLKLRLEYAQKHHVSCFVSKKCMDRCLYWAVLGCG